MKKRIFYWKDYSYAKLRDFLKKMTDNENQQISFFLNLKDQNITCFKQVNNHHNILFGINDIEKYSTVLLSFQLLHSNLIPTEENFHLSNNRIGNISKSNLINYLANWYEDQTLEDNINGA